jgi:hypothetical protein
LVNLSIIYYFSGGGFMKIRINKAQLMQGVKFQFIVANKPMIDKKIAFCFYDGSFYIVNHYDNGIVYKFNNYDLFRKKINDIIVDW